MNQLKVININGQLLIDSRDVADMIDVRHSDLLEKIDGYINHLENGKFRSQDFFMPNSYKVEGNNKTYACFLLTRKGCDMVANKMTGEKGVWFTAAYVTKFEEMEKEQQESIDISKLSPQMQMLKHLFDATAQTELALSEAKRELSEVKTTVTTIQETFLQRDEDWRKSMNSMLNAAAYRSGGNYPDLRSESYKLLEERAKCDLDKRLRNLKDRLSENGATKTKINETTRMDVIEADARLKEIYSTIIKEISIGTLKIAK